jgi:hypothetical protein
VREHLSSLRTFFEHLCAVAEFFPFDLWGPQVVDFMLKVLEPTLPPPATESLREPGDLQLLRLGARP